MHDPIITDRTRRNYEQGWSRYAEWCEATGHDPNDGQGSTVAAWLLAMYGEGRKPGTLKLWRVGVGHHYATELLDSPDPTKAEDVQRALQRITRAAARAGRTTESANAMTRDVLDRVLVVSVLRRACESDEQAVMRHTEAEAVLRLMYDAMLRSDEAVRAEWSDLSAKPHPKSGHYKLKIRHSKTDQNGNGRDVFVSRETHRALQRWRTVSPDPDGRICTAPSANALAGRMRRLGDVAGVKLSGHSPRRGAATDLANAGASERQLMKAGRWSRSDTVSRYVDESDAATGGMAMLYDNDDDHDHHDDDDAAKDAALRYMSKVIGDTTALLPHIAGLSMAVALRAPAAAPVVVHARRRLLELWPLEDPPPDCAREGCPGLVLTANPRPGERWCSDRCQDQARNARRAAKAVATIEAASAAKAARRP